MAAGALQVVIIADDLTGAMDAAAPFRRRGLAVRVLTGPDRLDVRCREWPAVLSVNTGTRHLSGEQAEAVVEPLVRTLAGLRPRLLFKKIDSTLRGNLVTETLAAMRASGSLEMLVCPAVPSQGRSLTGGRLYIHGVPLRETTIGRDQRGAPPGESLPDLYRPVLQETSIHLESLPAWQAAAGPEMLPRVTIVDAQTSAQLSAIAAGALHDRHQILFVGAAGLSEALAEAEYGATRPVPSPVPRPGKFLFVVGSRTGEAAEQVAALVEAHPGTQVLEVDELPPPGETYQGNSVTTADDEAIVLLRAPRETCASQQAGPDAVAASLAAGTARLLAGSPTSLLVATGGDTALALLDRLDADAIEVCGEVVPGVVHGLVNTEQGELRLVTKAGGFGDRRLFNNIIDFFRQAPVCGERTGKRHP